MNYMVRVRRTDGSMTHPIPFDTLEAAEERAQTSVVQLHNRGEAKVTVVVLDENSRLVREYHVPQLIR